MNIAEKSTNQRHIEKSAFLKQLRKDTGLTQADFAKRINRSREWVNQIENCHKNQMEVLPSDVEEKWVEVCSSSAGTDTLEKVKEFLLRRFRRC